MRTTINNKKILSYPLVERTIYLENDINIIIDFEIVGDLDFCLSFSKRYNSKNEALNEIAIFLKDETKNNDEYYFGNLSFEEKQMYSKKKLIKEILENTVKLPENGRGFNYIGDIDYLRQIL